MGRREGGKGGGIEEAYTRIRNKYLYVSRKPIPKGVPLVNWTRQHKDVPLASLDGFRCIQDWIYGRFLPCCKGEAALLDYVDAYTVRRKPLFPAALPPPSLYLSPYS